MYETRLFGSTKRIESNQGPEHILLYIWALFTIPLQTYKHTSRWEAKPTNNMLTSGSAWN